MNFALNSMFFDGVIVFVLLLMLVYGYFKGFVYRAYDLLATIVSLLLALYASSPLSAIFQIYRVEGIGEIVGNIINRFIIFIILFICLKVILSIIGKFVKPVIKNIIYTIGLFKCLDHFLGAIVSLIESTIIIYMVLLFVITPLVPGGRENIEQTVVASKILELIPSLTEEMESLSGGFDSFTAIINDGIDYDTFNTHNIAMLTSSLNTAYEHDLISQEGLETILMEYYDDIDMIGNPVSLNQEQYDELIELLSKVEGTNLDKTKILNKIIVSE